MADPQFTPEHPVQCSAAVLLTEGERRSLNDASPNEQLANWHVGCELEARHPGAHYATGQTVDGKVRWVRWDDRHLGQPEFVDRPRCDFRSEQDEPCLLFHGHPGTHRTDPRKWGLESADTPPASPERSHADYLAHRRIALTSPTPEVAQLHASLAIAAATNRLADLLERRADPN